MSSPLCLRCRAALRNSVQSHPRLLCPQQQRTSQQRRGFRLRKIAIGAPQHLEPSEGALDPKQSESLFESANNPPITNPSMKKNPKIKISRFIRKINTIPAGELETFRDPIDKLLEKPTWSVRSLLPAEDSEKQAPTITSSELHHLLRLSALPPPSSPEEESTMLRTLESQLHFVREIQSVDTTGVEPLQAIRDETPEGIREITIGLDSLKDALSQERLVGRHKRPRRRRSEEVVREEGRNEEKKKEEEERNPEEDWDVLGMAEKTVGRYFVVDSSGVGKVEGRIKSKPDAP